MPTGDGKFEGQDLEHDQMVHDAFKFDPGLEDFLNNPIAMVNLQPQPMSFGSGVPDSQGAEHKNGVDDRNGGSLLNAAGATVAMLTAAIMGKQSGNANVVDSVTSAVVPMALQPMKERAGNLLSRARPWKEFVVPLSIPSASDGCSRITANMYNFQTNYAILFVAYLILSIIWEPSALICVVMTVVVWVFFLKKNDDPDWKPAIGGTPLGPMQRWLLLAAATVLILLFTAGRAITNSVFTFALFAFIHGIAHEPLTKDIPGSVGGPPVPL